MNEKNIKEYFPWNICIILWYYDVEEEISRATRPDHRAMEDTQISVSGDLILQMYDCVKSKAFPSVFQSFPEYIVIGKIHENAVYSRTITLENNRHARELIKQYFLYSRRFLCNQLYNEHNILFQYRYTLCLFSSSNSINYIYL